MLTRKHRINCIGNSFLNRGELFFGSEEEPNNYKLLKWDKGNFKHISFDFEITGIIKCKNQRYITSDEDGQLRLLDKDYNTIDDNLSNYESILSDSYVEERKAEVITVWKGNIINRTFALMNLNDFNVINETRGSLINLSSVFVTFDRNDSGAHTGKISCFDSTDGNKLWHTNLSELNDFLLPRIVEIQSNFIKFSFDKVTLLLGLKSGRTLWKSDDSLFKYSKPNRDNDKLISFNMGYVEFDLETGQRKIDRRVYPEYEDFGRGGTPWFWESRGIIITVPGRTNKIYFYDTQNDEFIYIHEETEAKPYLAAKPILYHDGHLFVKDFDNKLFVYEVDRNLAARLDK